ncbi:MAG: alpha-L-arabinofuranosidase C-terminal domain-containing protein [Verrucomicrobiota bacterium]
MVWPRLFTLVVAAVSVFADEQLPAKISIEAHRGAGAVSPLLHGQFLEFMFEGIKGGVHAELIRNRSFEEPINTIGLSRHWERYPDDRNDDYGLSFHWDARRSVPGNRRRNVESVEHSLQIELREGVIPRHGIYQSRIPIRAGIEYHGSIWIRAHRFKGKVLVALEQDRTGGAIYAEADLSPADGDWRRYEFSLRPSQSDPLARFAILPAGTGELWIDQVSLMPGDAVHGVRRDVFEKIKALRPAFIRWPGGNVAQDYHWMWGIGPRDERPVWTNLSWKNEPEPSDFGTDEFIALCRELGAEPSITINVEGRGATASEAAEWVEYCNGPASSKFGALRAANGHPEPFNVRFWEVGNEIWGHWVRGHSDARTYAANFLRYAEAMRAVDPKIQLIAVGDNNPNWNRTVLKLAGSKMDLLAVHHYYTAREMKGDPLNLMARPLTYEKFYREMRIFLKGLELGRPVQLAINEWGLDIPEPRQHSIEAALFGARLLNVFERNSDLIAMSAVSDLVNGWPGGIIQASRHDVFTTPTYLVNQLYREATGPERVEANVECPTYDTSQEGKAIPYLDVVASRPHDRSEMFIKAVNTHPSATLLVRIEIQGWEPAPVAELAGIMASSLDQANSFQNPSAVTIRRLSIQFRPSFALKLPKHSIWVLKLRAAGSE